jgi:P-type E1-E2 ATPase
LALRAVPESLKADGVRIVMLTGDNRTTAQAAASKLGITDIEAEVLPEQKMRLSGVSGARAASLRWPVTV